MSNKGDLVERLRRLSNEGWAVRYEHDYILVEAADEIERLRRPSASPEAPVTSSHMPSHHVAHAGNMVEPEALEAARRIVDEFENAEALGRNSCWPVEAVTVARALLSLAALSTPEDRT